MDPGAIRWWICNRSQSVCTLRIMCCLSVNCLRNMYQLSYSSCMFRSVTFPWGEKCVFVFSGVPFCAVLKLLFKLKWISLIKSNNFCSSVRNTAWSHTTSKRYIYICYMWAYCTSHILYFGSIPHSVSLWCSFLMFSLFSSHLQNLNQNPRTLLPKFFGLYCVQSGGKNIRVVVMNNVLPRVVRMHLKYDLKGSTYKRRASKKEREKARPTFKDLDFMQDLQDGLMMDQDTCNALTKTLQRDCLVRNMNIQLNANTSFSFFTYVFCWDRQEGRRWWSWFACCDAGSVKWLIKSNGRWRSI